MAASEAQICNIALARIGVKTFITALSDSSAEAEACNILYAPMRDATLEAFPWPFATRRATLAVLAGVTRSGWSYSYALPTDCIAPRYLYAGERQPAARNRVAFAVEANDAGDGRILITDEQNAELVYTAKVTNPDTFSPLFRDALSWLLAADLALVLVVKPQLEIQCRQRFQMLISQAGAAALRQGQDIPEPESEFITGRG